MYTLKHCLWLLDHAVCPFYCRTAYLALIVCIVTSGNPTVQECIRFQGRCRTINIPQEIGTHYSQFGIFLLNDPNGTITRNIEHKHREHAAKINIEILQEWATERGKHPVNWNTLTEVLRDIELGALATEIEEVFTRSSVLIQVL